MKNLTQSQFTVEIQKLSNELASEIFSADLKNIRISPERTLTITEILFLEFPTALVDFRETQKQGHRRWKNLIGQAIKTGELKAIDGHIVSGHYHIWRNGQCHRPADSIIEKIWINPTTPTPVAAPAVAPAAPLVASEHDAHAAAVRLRSQRGRGVAEWYAATTAQAVRLARNGAKNCNGTIKMHHQFADELFKFAVDLPKGATYEGLKKSIREAFEKDEELKKLVYWPGRKNFLK